MLSRIMRYLKGLLGFKLDQLEDPEILLQQAQQEMQEAQAKNRERAVQAITQKNNLQALVDQTQKMVDNLQAKAELALKNGDRDLARQLLVEKGQYDATLNPPKSRSSRRWKPRKPSRPPCGARKSASAPRPPRRWR